MKKNRSKMLGILASIVMFVFATMSTYTANATEQKYDEIGVSSNPSFNVVMKVPADTVIPKSTFSYAIVPDNEITDDEKTDGFVSGIMKNGFPKIEDVEFEQNAALDKVNDNEFTHTETATVDFGSEEFFDEPGIYRYKITETNNNTGVGNITTSIKYLNVYVEDKNDGTVTLSDTTICTITTEKEIVDKDSENKTDDYIHNYPTTTLQVTKTVTGNQGSRDQYFGFIIKANPVEDKAVINDDAKFIISGIEANPTKTAATSFDDMSTNNVTEITGKQIKEGYTIYLQHGQTLKVSGLPKECGFEVEEIAEDGYTTKYQINDEAETNGNKATGTLSNSANVKFTNDKSGTIPTGVILSATGLIVLGIIVVAGIVFFGVRSKKKYEED